MTIIGITGGSGAGKTTVLTVLEELGACIIDCDAVYHRLLAEDRQMGEELRARFGPEVFAGGGALDRKALGRVVFGDPQALLDLNAITHRHVVSETERLLTQARAEGRPAAAVDAIALIECGLAAKCDAVVAVTAPAQARVKRLMAREGIPEDYARARIAAQKSDDYFQTHCDYVLHNDGTPEDCRRQARALFEKILTAERSGT